MHVFNKHWLEISKTKVLVAAVLSPDLARNSYKEFLQEAQPWADGAKKKEVDEARVILDKFVKAGPIRVTPMQSTETLMKSRLRSTRDRVVPRAEEDATWRKRVDAVGKFIGSTVPRSRS